MRLEKAVAAAAAAAAAAEGRESVERIPAKLASINRALRMRVAARGRR